MDAQQRPAAVRVVARVRPLFSAPGARIARANATSIALASEHEAEVEFPFSQCFGEDASQEAVCKDMCERAVADVVRGFNATILAYGQTGSGKTHTMMGDLDSPRDQGVIPRLALGLFRALRPGSAVKATFVEIYREALRDLLDARSDQTLRIRELDGSRVAIAGAAEQVCVNAGELLEVLRRGSAMRSVGSTRMNQDSSRSHSVLTVTVESVDEDGSALQSKLVLVDLAGSEAVKKTLAAGERLEEAKSINQSLSALGNVIGALVEKRSHVPFRDSKLTRLLQDSLGGTAVTTLVLNLSPAWDNGPETLSTLRFGSRAQKVENRAVKNVRRSVELLERLLFDAEQKLLLAGAPPAAPSGAGRAEEEELQAKLFDCESELDLTSRALEASRGETAELRARVLSEEQARVRSDAALGEVQLRCSTLELELGEVRDELRVAVQDLGVARQTNTFVAGGTPAPGANMLEQDVTDMTEKCVRLQVRVCELEEQLAAASQTQSSWQSWTRVASLMAEARAHGREKGALTLQLEQTQAQVALASRKLANRQEQISMLEAVVHDFQHSFTSKVEQFLARERALEIELGQYKRIFDAAHAARAAKPHLVVKPGSHNISNGGQAAEVPAEALAPAASSSSSSSSSTALVVFNMNNPLTNLKLLKERLFVFSTRSFRVRQDWVLDGRGGTELGFGAAVYPAGALLADYLGNRAGREAVRGRRVLELGTGVGAVGLACVAAGAAVVVSTDGDDKTVQLAAGNFALNDVGSSAVARKLLWGDLPALRALIAEFGPFHVCVASDIVALPYVEYFGALADTFKCLAQSCPDLVVLLAQQPRHVCEEDFFRILGSKASFGLDAIPEHALSSDFKGSQVRLLQLGFQMDDDDVL